MRADLHSHSTVSDGRLSPEALVARAHDMGVSLLALTDHDNTGGVPAATAAGLKLGVKVLAGVEISADYEPGTMHILGLRIDISNEALQAKLTGMQEARRNRNPQIVERLRAAGLDISFAEVQAAAKGGQIGRPHFAEVLLTKKLVPSFEEAFDKYLGKGGPAYVSKARMKSREAIEAIHAAGGLAILAHPIQLRLQAVAEESLIAQLQGEGLDGIEAYHSDHLPADVERYLGIAAGLVLRVSGGSDFHGIPGKNVELGRPEFSMALAEELLK